MKTTHLLLFPLMVELEQPFAVVELVEGSRIATFGGWNERHSIRGFQLQTISARQLMRELICPSVTTALNTVDETVTFLLCSWFIGRHGGDALVYLKERGQS